MTSLSLRVSNVPHILGSFFRHAFTGLSSVSALRYRTDEQLVIRCASAACTSLYIVDRRISLHIADRQTSELSDVYRRLQGGMLSGGSSCYFSVRRRGRSIHSTLCTALHGTAQQLYTGRLHCQQVQIYSTTKLSGFTVSY